MVSALPVCLATLGFAVLATVVFLIPMRRSTHIPTSQQTVETARYSVLVSKLLQVLRERSRAWAFLFYGPDYIRDGYVKSGGKPYSVIIPEARYVFVPPGQYLDEVNRARESELSMYAASKQMFMPEYTMHGFNWHDVRGKESIGFTRVLRGISRVQLPLMMPTLSDVVSHEVKVEMAAASRVVNGTSQTAIYPMLLRVVARLNSLVFFGEEATRHDEFFEDAVKFIDDVLTSAELLRILPKFMLPILGRITARRYRTQTRLFNILVDIVQQRLETHALNGEAGKTHTDCVQWIIDAAPKKNPWSAERIVHEVMALWFGALHALSMSLTYAALDLCVHPEYVEALRAELESPAFDTFMETADGLSLLDSFIKESARVTPFEAVSVRRRALQDFQLSDGTKANKGDWLVTPFQAINYDETYYHNAASFNAFRFVKPSEEGSDVSSATTESQFAEPTAIWHFWGSGKITCPGRFYASTAMKLVLAHFLLNFDVELVNKKAPRSWNWRTTINPRKDVRVIFRDRERV